MKTRIRAVFTTLVSLNLILHTFFAPMIAFADTMPESQELKDSISQQANSQASTINPQPQVQPQTQPTASTNTANTGDNVSTDTSSQNNSNTEVNNQNTASADQTVNATADSGYNEASRNISIGGDAGVIQTGDATVNTQTQADVNSSATSVSGNGSSGAGTTSNTANTGNNLSSSTTSDSSTTTLVNNGNSTVINQTTNANANTGYNIADRNISIGGTAGMITTGNASTNTNYLVTANGSVTLIGGNSNGNGPGSGASILLANTGDSSFFRTSANNTQYIVVTNENRALLSQICGSPIGANQLTVNASGCTANTGYNVADRNVGLGSDAGVIRTSDAQVNVVMLAQTNSNTSGIDGGNNGTNSQSDIANTGDDSNVTVNSNNNQSATVNNTNTANTNQTVNAYANTGHNRANRNISLGGDAGIIQTGNATVNVLMGVEANKNQTDISGGGGGGGSYGPTASQDVINTGDGSSFTTSSTSSNQTTVTNINLLNVFQNVIASATTGFNRAARNIGEFAGVIRTGDASVNVNTEVLANENITYIGDDPQDNVTTTPTPTPTDTVAGAEDTNNAEDPSDPADPEDPSDTLGASSSNSNSSNNSDPYDGQVLGAAAELPATGPESNLIMNFAILLSSGLMLRKAGTKKHNSKSKRVITN